MSGPCFSASVGGHPLRPPTRLRLGKPLPYQLADGTQAPPKAGRPFERTPFVIEPLASTTSCGISSPFELLSLSSGQVTNALLTRSPLSIIANTPFDLHVLGTPPAFILSQDQTLRKSYKCIPVLLAFPVLPFPGFTIRLLTTLQLLRGIVLPFTDQNPMSHFDIGSSDRQASWLWSQTPKAPCKVFSDLPSWLDLVV